MTTRNASTWLWSLLGAGAIATVAVVAQSACSTQAAGVTCQAGSSVACSCEGALTGTAECDSTGHESACNCSDATTSSGSGSSSGSSSGLSSGSSSGSSSGGSGGDSGGLPAEGGTGGGEGGVEDGATGG